MMRYKFYDRDGKLLEMFEDAKGTPIEDDEEIINQFDGHTASRWKVVAALLPVDDVQKVKVRVI